MLACRPGRATPWVTIGPLLVAGCSLFRAEPRVVEQPPAPAQVGVASYYGRGFRDHGTASGERFDQGELTAASRSLPIGTRARVTNLANGSSVVVRVNDRGPFVRGRVLDVSYAAARELGMLRRGTARVRIEVLDDSSGAVTGRARWRGARRSRYARRSTPRTVAE